MAGQAVPGEGPGLGRTSGRVHGALPYQRRVGEGVPLGDVLEYEEFAGRPELGGGGRGGEGVVPAFGSR